MKPCFNCLKEMAQTKSVREFISPSIVEGDHLDGHGLRGESFGRNDPHASSASAEKPVTAQGESSRLQELKRLRRRNAIRRQQCDLPGDLFRVKDKRDPREPANVFDDGQDVCVLEAEGLRGGSPRRPRRAHDEKAQEDETSQQSHDQAASCSRLRHCVHAWQKTCRRSSDAASRKKSVRPSPVAICSRSTM
jgi:hypothetical protein